MLPNSLRKQLSYYSYPFGGLREIESALSEDQLVDLSLHDDPILIVDPTLPVFSDLEGIDISAYGFNPGTSFSIYNDKNEFLYKRISEGSFGDHSFDREVLESTDHAHYLQLIFNSSVPNRVLLWVARKPSIQKVSKVISASKLERDRSIIRSGVELLFTFGNSVRFNGEDIDFYYLEGVEGNLTVSSLIRSAKERYQHFQYKPRDVIYLKPKSSLWAYIEQDGRPLIGSNDVSQYIGIDPDQVNITLEGIISINFRNRQPKKIMANKPINPSSVGISSKNSISSTSIVLERKRF